MDILVHGAHDADSFALGHLSAGELDECVDVCDAVAAIAVVGIEVEDGLHRRVDALTVPKPGDIARGGGRRNAVVGVRRVVVVDEEDMNGAQVSHNGISKNR